MSKPRLVPADETLTHQIVETFSSVGQSDLSWTEKIWVAAHARDGSFQVVLGVGKYTNRGVFDGFAGVSRGQEQWTVRASRRLAPRPDLMAAGPLSYEIVEPLRSIRAKLEPNEQSPIAFDFVMENDIPPAVEERRPERGTDGYRLAHDVLRYHAVGTPHGWMAIDGERVEISDDTWVAFRDHSWGVRPGIGGPLPGLAPDRPQNSEAQRSDVSAMGFWCPMRLQRSGGSPYSIMLYYSRSRSPAGEVVQFDGGEDLPDGEHRPFLSLTPDVRFDNLNRRFLGGVLHVVTADGTDRPLTLTPISDTGFHLGTGLYGGYQGHWQGEWRDELHVEGDYVKDCALPEVARRIHPIRDVLVRVDDPVGGGTGFGNIESGAFGGDPEMGLTAEASFS